ncbi:MAG TPA: hypothetical protein ENH55_13120 [Aurantimonas coralicida]|uniref:Uncharacterized protein n=2 Tax=root TaxID=1 RepID=A0A9C9TFU9_9HYPH|nr:hypothetical protein [Aurantimonas coralicida]HET99626.1 hypothetical protein [Aurantimonas coralicida]
MTEPDLLTWAETHAHRVDPSTSVAAALHARKFTGGHCGIIYRLLAENRPIKGAGLTSLEIAARTELSYHEVARRIADLKHAGLVIDSGERRRNPNGRQAAVWRARDG